MNECVKDGRFKTLKEAYKLVLSYKLNQIPNIRVNGIRIYGDFPIGDFDPNTQLTKIPFIKRIRSKVPGQPWEENSTEVQLVKDD
jgi:hypothetical protein